MSELLPSVGIGVRKGVRQEIWDELLPALPVAEFPGRFELTHRPGKRASFATFGIDPGEALTAQGGTFVMSVTRFTGHRPVDWRDRLLKFSGHARDRRHVFYLLDAIIVPASEGASLVIQVLDERGFPVEGTEVRAL